jgi:hypothetical protein
MFSCIAERRRLWSILGAAILILFILSCSNDDTVPQNQNEGINYSEWMSYVDDDTLAYKVSLPSSHDTASWEDNLEARGLASNIHSEKVLAVTQNANLNTQWAAGARGFDLRVYWETKERNGVKGNIGVAHGSGAPWYESRKLFDELFADIVDLLNTYPTEYVFIRVAIERDITSTNAPDYIAAVKNLMAKYSYYIYGTPDINTTVRELRGKIVLLPAVISGKGELKGGYEDPFLEYGPKLDEFYNPAYNPVDNHDPAVLIQNFIDINNESSKAGFGFGESNHPGTTKYSPEHFAPEIQTKLISFLSGIDVDGFSGGDKLKHIGVLNIDFISAGDGLTKDNGERLAHAIIEVNFRE